MRFRLALPGIAFLFVAYVIHEWRKNMISRRAMVAAGAFAIAAAQAATSEAAVNADLVPAGAGKLKSLVAALGKAPRRRDFKSVPMILTDHDQWDHEALSEVIAYRGTPKQVWDNTDIAGPWLNLARNSLNAQIWSFKNPDFLCVSGTHGAAHLALYDQSIWDKYKLADLTNGKFKSNTLIEQPKVTADAANFEDPEGAFSSAENSIPTLMQRGVVFLACHNAIAELSHKLFKSGNNPDKLSSEQLVAELTNHLIPDVVLTPGVVATLPLLQQAGFHYAK
jgi:hypothetical protein